MDTAGPLTTGQWIGASDVQPNMVRHLRSTADGEGVPLHAGNVRDADENPVPWPIVEVDRSLDDQVYHFGWQDDTLTHVRVPDARSKPAVETNHSLHQKQRSRDHKPPPVTHCMEQEDDVEGDV